MPLPCFRLRTLMIAVAVVATTLAISCADRVPRKVTRQRGTATKNRGEPPAPYASPIPPRDRSGLFASTKVADQEVLATIADDARSVRVSIAGAASFATISLLPTDGRATELRICAWSKMAGPGVALAIESTHDETRMRSYHWATAHLRPDKTLSNPTHNVFLRSMADHTLSFIVNPPGMGDTIYMVLEGRRETKSGTKLDGYVFIHACPVGPWIQGRLYRIAATPEVGIPGPYAPVLADSPKDN